MLCKYVRQVCKPADSINTLAERFSSPAKPIISIANESTPQQTMFVRLQSLLLALQKKPVALQEVFSDLPGIF
jgi:hypothetical protein